MVVSVKLWPAYLACFALAMVVAPMSDARGQCRLCTENPQIQKARGQNERAEKPLRIEITANLDFSRFALLNRTGGEVAIDPMTGQRQVSGAITSLGGLSLHGQGRLTGEPGRLVRVTMPEQITLNAPDGSTAELVKLETDLPVQARLDDNGRLKFAFGGKLRVTGGAGGQYRGRIAITADYE